MKPINFKMLEYTLRHGWETDFSYKNEIFWIYNFNENGESTWWFVCNSRNIDFEICDFENLDFLIDWLKVYKIDGVTVQEIFEKWLYDGDAVSGFDISYFNAKTLKELQK